jgi:predicted esterase YcpF (UPF0227 family)
MGLELPSKWRRYHEALWLSARLWRALGHSYPRGPVDGQRCLVIPGFLTSDRSALELRRALAEQGFRVYQWGLGINKGAYTELFDALKARVNEIYDGRKILIVGWSLGGLFARELARQMPEKISAVVTMGSPISCDLKQNNVWKVYEWITGHTVDQTPVKRICEKPPVPSLAIWSKNDGLIPVNAAKGTNFERDDEFEISCTHMAFGLSYVATRKAAKKIADWFKNL